ncbi:transcription termination/antitermination protein NusG [Agrobacterium rosae]
MMQHRGDLLGGAISEIGRIKLERIADQHAARRRWLSMASRRIVAEYPNRARWICLRVMTGREMAVEKLLMSLEIDAFVATRKGKIHHRRGRVIPAVDMPVLIGYVLVRCVPSDTAMSGLETVEHVIGVIGGWVKPMPIDEDFVNRYREKAREGAYDYERPGIILRSGEKVRVIDGPFGGATGGVVSAPGDGIGDAVIEIVLFGKSVPMMTPLANLEKL